MELVKYLKASSVVLNLKGRTHEEVIFELADALFPGDAVRRDIILNSIYAVEDIKSTAVGKGVAVPHGRTDVAQHVRVAFGRSKKGIEWATPDGIPIRMVWLIVNPLDESDEYLKVLSQVTKVSSRQESRNAIMNARDPGEVIRIIKESKARNHARRS